VGVLAWVIVASGLPVIQTEPSTDRGSSVKVTVGLFQTDSRSIKDIIMRENATHKIIVARLLPVIKDVALLK
jgi:hypothetical protein